MLKGRLRAALGSTLVLTLLFIVGCAGSKTARPVVTHEGRGKIVEVDASKSRVRIDHEKMNGYMDAMTMWFAVKDSKLLDDLKPGDSVTFTISEEGSADEITRIERVP